MSSYCPLLARASRMLLLLLALPLGAQAQSGEPLRTFGYFQSQFRYSDEHTAFGNRTSSSFSLQQLNLMLAKELTPRLSGFINVELTNSYAFSTDQQLGSYKLEEAWVRYRLHHGLRVKAGLQIPTFNNLNEIKNRTPLLPYILRPLVYETSLNGVIDLTEYVPQRAYVQVYGTQMLRDWRFDYAAYLGNNEDFLIEQSDGTLPSGADISEGVMVGGRLGMRFRTLKWGVSATIDDKNETNVGVGAIDRYRVGGDLSFTYGPLYFEGEVIRVLHRIDDDKAAVLEAAAQHVPELGPTLDKLFYYGTLGTYLNDRLFAYGTYGYIQDDGYAYYDEGYALWATGLAFRPVEPISLKLQYVRYNLLDDTVPGDNYGSNILVAISIFY